MTASRTLRLESNRGSRRCGADGNNHVLRIIRSGERHIGWIRDVDNAGADGNGGEAVVAICIGRGGADRAKWIDHGNGKSTEVCFTSTLGSVAIGVSEYVTGDSAQLLETNRSCWRGNPSGNRNGLWVVGSGECRVGWIGYVHRGGTGRNSGEAVVARYIGGGGPNGSQCIGKCDGYATQVDFSGGLRSVAIGVGEDVTGDGAERLEPDRGSRRCCRGEDSDSLWIISRREDIADRISHIQRGGARSDRSEGVVAVGISSGSARCTG